MNFRDVRHIKFDFVKHRKKYFIASGFIILLGLLSLLIFGLNLGIDFVSGTRVEIFIGQAFDEGEIIKELKGINLEPKSVVTAGAENDRAVLRYDKTLQKEEIAQIRGLYTEKFGEKVDVSASTVDPTISRELAWKAFYSVLIASIGIILYVTIRFEFRFAVSAIVALLHDAFMVIAFFSIFQLEVDLPFIAAVLTIVGYSINDTIVIFDRIRENLKYAKVKKVEDVENVVNNSIKQTLARSINTVLTVLFAAVALFILGGEGIRNFSLALLIGLISGAYSSIFIASQLWLTWKGKDMERAKFRSAS